MKRTFTLIATATLLTCAAMADITPLQSGTKVKFNELPQAVQTAVTAQAGSAPIEDIDRGTLNGRTVYEVAFKRSGQHTELRVAEDGSVIDTIVAGASTQTQPTQQAQVTPLQRGTKVQFNELPQPVKNAVTAQLAGAQVEDIDRGILNGRTVYEVAFKRNGQHTELRVAEDGSVVDTIVAGTSTQTQQIQQAQIQPVQPSTPVVAAPPQSANDLDAYNAGFDQMIKGSRKVTLNQLPPNVQKIIRQRSAGAHLDDIELGTVGNQPVYQAAYKKNGKHTELRISSNGKFVREVSQGVTIYASDPSLIGFRYGLINHTPVSFQQMPAHVQQVAKARLGQGATIQNVKKGTAGNITVYQIGYTQNGQHGELRIGQDGKFVHQVLAGRTVTESAGAQAPK